MKTNEPLGKTEQLLAYLVKNHDLVSITSLMKLSYIVDLVSINKTRKKISDFEYRRYTYGPFDDSIYERIQTLLGKNIIHEEIRYTSTGDEFIVFKCDKSEIAFDALTEDEKRTIDEVLQSVRGYGAKALTELAYKTKPMLRLGAELGNTKGLNKKLNLRAK